MSRVLLLSTIFARLHSDRPAIAWGGQQRRTPLSGGPTHLYTTLKRYQQENIISPFEPNLGHQRGAFLGIGIVSSERPRCGFALAAIPLPSIPSPPPPPPIPASLQFILPDVRIFLGGGARNFLNNLLQARRRTGPSAGAPVGHLTGSRTPGRVCGGPPRLPADRVAASSALPHPPRLMGGSAALGSS